jgi:3-oxoadipate enol-lactonase
MPFVRADDLTVHYDLAGPAGAPVVLFANSLGTNFHVWDSQVAAFAQTCRVLRYDMRGHGLTDDAAPATYTLDRLADDVRALLDGLAIERVSLVGLSIGGLVGQRFAAKYPERLDALALCATANQFGAREVWDTRIAAILRDGMSGLVSGVLERWFTPATHANHPDIIAGFGNMLQRMTPGAYAACCAVVRDADERADDALIQTPTLIVAGANDPVTPPASGAAMHALIAGSQMTVLENAAHILCVEQPAAFNAATLTFLHTHINTAATVG